MIEAMIVSTCSSSAAESSSFALSIINVPMTFSSTNTGSTQKAILSLDSIRSGGKSLMEVRGIRVLGTPFALPSANTSRSNSSIW